MGPMQAGTREGKEPQAAKPDFRRVDTELLGWQDAASLEDATKRGRGSTVLFCSVIFRARCAPQACCRNEACRVLASFAQTRP